MLAPAPALRRCFFAAAALWLGATADRCAAADLSGFWVGRWESHTTGHSGPLRCRLVRLDDSRYEARFRGRFLKVIPFWYSVVLDARHEGNQATLSGRKYLGRRYGTFYFQATVSPTTFTASYSADDDHGRFSLSRRR